MKRKSRLSGMKVKPRRKRLVSQYMLSDRQEEPKPSDYGRYDVPSDKIHVNDEPYESLFSVSNREDAHLFKRIFNEIAMKHLGVKFPIAIRRGYQNKVFYDIYKHRWSAEKDGRLVELGDFKGGLKLDSDKVVAFKEEVNAKLGKVY